MMKTTVAATATVMAMVMAMRTRKTVACMAESARIYSRTTSSRSNDTSSTTRREQKTDTIHR